MNTQRSTHSIDNGLYQLYIDIQLRDIENDFNISLSEKEQLKAILTTFREIDGNISYPIFQQIFQNSTKHSAENDQKLMVTDSQSIEQEVLDTSIIESITVVPESHQAHKSTTKHIPSTKNTSKTARSQAARIGNHTASIKNHLPNTEYHSPSTEDRNQRTEDCAAVNSAVPTVNSALAFQPKTSYSETQLYPSIVVPSAIVQATDEFIEKPLSKILLANPRKEMNLIKTYPQRSSAVFRARMNAINEPKTAEQKAFLEKFDVHSVMQDYKKPMNEFIGLLSHGRQQMRIDKCRQMLCAYQIGRITNQLLHKSPLEDQEKLEKSLFRHLSAAIIKNHIRYKSFTSLCVNSFHLVEHVGVHALLVPEVISPAILKQLDGHSLLSLEKHLDDEWPSQFKKLARLTYYGEIVVSRNHFDDTMSGDQEKAYPGLFLSSI